MAGNTASLLFAGLTTSPAREFVADRIDVARHTRVLLPCVGRWAVATAAVARGVAPAAIEASDLSLFSSVIGYLADPRLDLDELGTHVPERLGRFTAGCADEVELGAGILLAGKYLSLPAKNVYSVELRREVFANAATIRTQVADGLREQVRLLVGCRYDVRDVRQVLTELADAGPEVFGYVNLPGYCLAPDHLILSADLRWRPAAEYRVGDHILTFEEQARPGNKNRRWTEATILRSDPATKDCVRVTLDDGTSVVCSADHPWLTEGPTLNRREWVPARHLLSRATVGRGSDRGPRRVLRLLHLWSDPLDYEDGWLAGIFDGEGHVSAGSANSAPKLGIAQAEGAVLDRIEAALCGRGIGYSTNWVRSEGRRPVANLLLRGGFNEVLHFLGSVRPGRLIANLQAQGYGDRQAVVIEKPLVVAVEPLGPQPVQSIQTSSGTYVGEGFAHHNSGGYTKMYGAAEEVLWTCRLATGEFDPAEVRGALERLTDSKALCVAYVHHGDADVPEGWTKLAAISPTVDRTDYLIANQDADGRRYAHPPRWDGEPKRWPVYADQPITADSVVEFARVDRDTALHYRDLFVHRLGQSKAERYGLMLIDGRVTTAFGLVTRDLLRGASSHISETFGITVTSDRYARLGKLFMLCLTTEQFKLWATATWPMDLQGTEPRGIKTASPTQHHEGKTDRGVLKLVRREPRPGGGFQLLYEGDFRAGDTYAAALGRWLERFGTKHRPGYTAPEELNG